MILCFCFYYFFTVCFKIGSLFFCKTTTKQCKISIWQKKKNAEKVQTSKEYLGAHSMHYNPCLQSLSEKELLFFMMSWALLWCWRHFSEYMSVMAIAKLKINWFWWDFGDKMYGRKGDVLLTACDNTQAIRYTEAPASNPLGDTIVHFL